MYCSNPEHHGAPVIFDVKSSQALADAITAAGGKPVMWKTGHSLIEAKMHEIHAPLAGELSGHMYIADGYYGFDDALYAAGRLLRIIASSGKSLEQLLDGVPVYPVSPEIRVDCPDRREVRHRGSRGGALVSHTPGGHGRRRPRDVRHGLGPHPRVKHPAGARIALRSAHRRRPRCHSLGDGGLAHNTGRDSAAGP